MGQRTEILLQVIFIGFTTCLLALLVIKFYPEAFFARQKAIAIEQNEKVLKETQSLLAENDPPTSIDIDSLDIHLVVAPGVITNNVWTLYDDKVSWLSTSQTPGNGNIIIYGHKRKGIFGNLHNIAVNDEVKVKTNKATYLYTVISKETILPSDTEAILSDKNILTLYTCDGPLDQTRLLVKARFEQKE
ncbi:MAG: sortase [Candidatus Curtissbacteria bacterium]|nr:sortase [Candidatus Curtissbacteria bacterium]